MTSIIGHTYGAVLFTWFIPAAYPDHQGVYTYFTNKNIFSREFQTERYYYL